MRETATRLATVYYIDLDVTLIKRFKKGATFPPPNQFGGFQAEELDEYSNTADAQLYRYRAFGVICDVPLSWSNAQGLTE